MRGVTGPPAPGARIMAGRSERHRCQPVWSCVSQGQQKKRIHDFAAGSAADSRSQGNSGSRLQTVAGSGAAADQIGWWCLVSGSVVQGARGQRLAGAQCIIGNHAQ